MPLTNKPTIPVPEDTDKFPFGAHKGKRYADVPARYLDWAVGQSWINKWPEVVAYVAKHRRVIDMELDEVGDKDDEKSPFGAEELS